jgi:hypothetical protein
LLTENVLAYVCMYVLTAAQDAILNISVVPYLLIYVGMYVSMYVNVPKYSDHGITYFRLRS